MQSVGINNEAKELQSIRNIGFIAHIDAGKTTVSERVLYLTGKIYKVGEVHDGTATMDWMEQERERGITITSAATSCYWNDHQINIIDTPGHVDFTAEVERSLRVLDGGVVVFDAVAGVQPQSEKVWRQADTYQVPRICFINKMDRLGSNFDRTIDMIRQRLGAKPVAIQVPVGNEDAFSGFVDVIEERQWVYQESGEAPIEQPMTTELRTLLEGYKDALVEKVAETDDDLMIKYLEGTQITQEELKVALRQATITNQLVPVLCGAALKNKGVHSLCDAVVDYLPSPCDLPSVNGIDSRNGETVTRDPSLKAPLAALSFKVVTDPYVGRVVYFRVYSGTVKAGSIVYNSTKGVRERMGRILKMHAQDREEIQGISAGNIAAAVGLKNTFTGETICDESNPVVLESITFPEPVLSVAIEPKTKEDEERLQNSLIKLAEEDPTFKVKFDKETGQTIISGMGELHLEILIDRLKREFKVGANVGKPRVAYRETLTKSAKAEGKFIRQSGGRGQYGHVVVEVEPLGRGQGIQFENLIVGGAVPKEYIKPVERGIRSALDNGVIAGFPFVDAKVKLLDGSYHPVDSSELAFSTAGSMAVQSAVNKAGPVLLEPIMEVQVLIPGDFLGDVLGDLNSRRASIRNVETKEQVHQVDADVPLSELFGYTTALRSLTQGRATHNIQFGHYKQAQGKVLEEIKLSK